jgi:Fe-S-cluster containining protein
VNIRFECQPGCTICCREQGFIYLTEDDLERAARFLGMTPGDFERRYVYRTVHLLRLRTPRVQRCPFLRDFGCAINDAKPTQCRLYPFWPELVEHPANWHHTLAHCPGMGQGEPISIETARERAAGMRAAFPTLYR